MDRLEPDTAQSGREPVAGMPSRAPRGWFSALRRRLYMQMEPRMHPEGLSRINQAVVALIIIAAGLAVLETEPSLDGPYGKWFAIAETVLGVAFAIEYVLRVWVEAEDGTRGYGWKARLRYMISPAAIIDLVATVGSFVPAAHGTLLLRIVRLLRILRLAKLGRMSQAWSHMGEAIASRREELILSLFVGLGLMVASATALYFAEGDIQPDKFGSIPRALWWAVATMTTIGYGDVYPITAFGRFLAGLTALCSIGLIAMPAGILASAFSEALQKHKAGKKH